MNPMPRPRAPATFVAVALLQLAARGQWAVSSAFGPYPIPPVGTGGGSGSYPTAATTTRWSNGLRMTVIP